MSKTKFVFTEDLTKVIEDETAAVLENIFAAVGEDASLGNKATRQVAYRLLESVKGPKRNVKNSSE